MLSFKIIKNGVGGYCVYSAEIEILLEIAIASIPLHAKYIRFKRLVTSLCQRMRLPTFKGIRGPYLSRCLIKQMLLQPKR